ncbi:MAG: type 1 glutamine amidotransferase [Gammaproteobacteria bacterium]|nr:type 1 glutamine amidotransferase [Gammaproteobacteria bacterium]
MKIGILQAGHCPDNLRPQYGDYDEFFKRFLAGNDFEYATYPVVDGVIPDNPGDMDGWIITGSKFGAYEDHDWIPPLEKFLRDTYAAAVPIVGICFGHQILAQALGGKVEKFDGGWSVGVESYTLDGHIEEAQLIAWHQDQVIEPPPGASVVGTSAFCRHAALAYGDRAYTIQPHPEFEPGFVSRLIESRPGILPEDVVNKAITSLSRETSSAKIALHVAEFFKRARY